MENLESVSVPGPRLGRAPWVINTQPGLSTLVFKQEPVEAGWGCEPEVVVGMSLGRFQPFPAYSETTQETTITESPEFRK